MNYIQRLEKLKEKYEPRILKLLNDLKTELERNNILCDELGDMCAAGWTPKPGERCYPDTRPMAVKVVNALFKEYDALFEEYLVDNKRLNHLV